MENVLERARLRARRWAHVCAAAALGAALSAGGAAAGPDGTVEARATLLGVTAFAGNPAVTRGSAGFTTFRQILAARAAAKRAAELTKVATATGDLDGLDGAGSNPLASAAPAPIAAPGAVAGDSAAGSAVDLRRRAAFAEIDRDMARIEACAASDAACDGATVRQLAAILKVARSLGDEARLAYVNRSVNALIDYRSDAERWGESERWAGPIAAAEGGGDCEDFALAKLALLRAAGMPESDLWVTLLLGRRGSENHAVLMVRTAGGFRVLDNRTDAMAFKVGSTRLVPIYVLNGTGTWLRGEAVSLAAVGSR